MKKNLLSLFIALLCCVSTWATEGALSGRFTINSNGDQIVFSQGNLQYQPSTGTWRFATNQYDYITFDINAYSASSDKWIDLFAYGTSGYNNGQTNYQPYVVGADPNTYYQGNLTGNADWGYNAISNGGNTENFGWRTPTRDEWIYLFSGRTNAASKYGHGSINGVNGMILLPDKWTTPDGLSFTPGNSIWTNSYTIEQWNWMQKAGAVFLPASGSCNNTGIPPESLQNQNGFYRAGTAAYYVYFAQGSIQNCTMSFHQYGDAVRLVQAAPVEQYSLKQDADGNYLLGSVQDWQAFAELVQTTPTANAKMTADIDLGTQITMIAEDVDQPYQGTFDGQGHTLTVNWTADGEDRVAPFRYADGATIKRLHVDGSITKTGTYGRCPAGILACSLGSATTTITECWSSVSLYAFDTMGGLLSVACGNSTTNIVDCMFSGSISASNSSGCSGGFASHADKEYLHSEQGEPTVNITRGLNLGTFPGSNAYLSYTFIRMGNIVFGTHTVTSCYYKNVYGNAQGTQVTDTQLADGTTTTALNAGRTGDDAVWVQDPVTNQPMLKIFVSEGSDPVEPYSLKQDADGNYLLGSVQDWQAFAELVQTTPTANAKMTADIDLGDDQTTIGSGNTNAENANVVFKGVFDGNGHTLTINYNTSEGFYAPIRHISGATIKNLHVTGSLVSSGGRVGGIVCGVFGGSSIQNKMEKCRCSVVITSNCQVPVSDAECVGGLVGQVGFISNLSLEDCIFDGEITGHVSNVIWSGLVGVLDGTVNTTRCLQAGSFNDLDNGTTANSATIVCRWQNAATSIVTMDATYYIHSFKTVQGIQATTEQLADGTITAALQAGRAEEVWVQDPVTNQPMLKLVASEACNIPPTDIYETACDSFPWLGTMYYASGDISKTFKAVNGCDSVVTLHLTINNSNTGEEYKTAESSYEWHGTTYTASGDYTYTLTNVAGCDSVATLHLTITPPPPV